MALTNDTRDEQMRRASAAARSVPRPQATLVNREGEVAPGALTAPAQRTAQPKIVVQVGGDGLGQDPVVEHRKPANPPLTGGIDDTGRSATGFLSVPQDAKPWTRSVPVAADPRATDPNDTTPTTAPPAASTPPATQTPAAGGGGAAAPAGGTAQISLPGATQRDFRSLFTADDNLRNRQINPEWQARYMDEAANLIRAIEIARAQPIAGTDLTGARSLAERAIAEIQGIQAGPDVAVAPTDLTRARAAADRVAAMLANPETAAMRSRLQQVLDGVTNAPDRKALADEMLSIYDARQAPLQAQQIRDVGRAAASYGRIGSGLTTNRLTDLGTAWKQDRDLFGREVINDALQNAMSDRLAALDATQGVASFLSSDDLARMNVGRALFGDEMALAAIPRQEALEERDYQSQQAAARAEAAARRASEYRASSGHEAELAGITRRDAEADRAWSLAEQEAINAANLAEAQGLTGLDETRFNWESRMRDELRTERGYQNELAETAIDRRIQQAEMEDKFQTTELNRRLALVQSLMAAGVDPALIQALFNQGGY